MLTLNGNFTYETIKIHAKSDCLCHQIGQDGNARLGGAPEVGGVGGYILQLEEEIRRPWDLRTQEAKEPGGRELTAEETCDGFEPGQTNIAGRTEKKVLRPSRKRKMVSEIMMEYNVSTSRCCNLVLLAKSMYYYKSQGGGDAVLRMRMKEIAAYGSPMAFGASIYCCVAKVLWTTTSACSGSIVRRALT